MKRSDIQEGLSRLNPFLRAYLTQHGVEIDAGGRFKCFAHDEKEPSANFVPGTEDTKWHCHGCGSGGDLCDACHYLEGRPQSGPGWYKETFLYLCEEFNVKVNGEDKTLSEEDMKQLQIDQAFAKAARLLLTQKKSDRVEAKLAEYAWSKRTLQIFGIGGIQSFDKFISEMTKAGFTKKFLEEIGLTDKRIFRPECLIFTIKDGVGRPIAFAGRWLDFKKIDDQVKAEVEEKGPEYLDQARKKLGWQPKYVNTKFEKSRVLFGFHAAKINSRSIYVFEGYADCVSAFNVGLINSVAVCGAAWNEHHLELARQAGIKHLICAFDPDNGGEGGKQRFVDFCEKSLPVDMRGEILELPKGEEKQDPDLYIRTSGLAKFRALPRYSAFFWSLQAQLKSEDNLTVANLGAQRIVKQPDPILRYGMLEQLSEATSLPKEFLWDAVLRLAAQDAGDIAKAILKSAEWMAWMKSHQAEAKKAITHQETPAPVKAAEIPGHASLTGTGLVPATDIHAAEKTKQMAANWK